MTATTTGLRHPGDHQHQLGPQLAAAVEVERGRRQSALELGEIAARAERAVPRRTCSTDPDPGRRSSVAQRRESLERPRRSRGRCVDPVGRGPFAHPAATLDADRRGSWPSGGSLVHGRRRHLHDDGAGGRRSRRRSPRSAVTTPLDPRQQVVLHLHRLQHRDPGIRGPTVSPTATSIRMIVPCIGAVTLPVAAAGDRRPRVRAARSDGSVSASAVAVVRCGARDPPTGRRRSAADPGTSGRAPSRPPGRRRGGSAACSSSHLVVWATRRKSS